MTGPNGQQILPVPVPVKLPSNYFYPPNSQPLDIIGLQTIGPGVNVNVPILTFTCPTGFTAYLTGYATALNGAFVPNAFNWFPSINGMRQFPFHGDPSNNFQITYAISNTSDISNVNLRTGFATMLSGQTLLWTVTTNNLSAPFTPLIRQVGYLIPGTPESTS